MGTEVPTYRQSTAGSEPFRLVHHSMCTSHSTHCRCETCTARSASCPLRIATQCESDIHGVQGACGNVLLV